MKEKILISKTALTICSSLQTGQKMTKVILDLASVSVKKHYQKYQNHFTTSMIYFKQKQ